MRKMIVIVCFICIICSKSLAYTDLTQEHWAYQSVQELTSSKIINGYPDGTFKPDNEMTIAEFSTILCKVLELKIDMSISLNHWANKEIGTLNQKGIMDMSDYGKFNPDEAISRWEICKMIVNSFDATKNAEIKSIYNFIDIDSLNKEEQRVASILKEVGILNGYPDGTVKFNKTSNRAEVSRFVCLLKENLSELEEFNINKQTVYENNVAVADVNSKNIKLKKLEYAKDDIEYCSTTIKNIQIFNFDDGLGTEYKNIFEKIYSSDEPYFLYRNKFGKGNYVLAIQFVSKNNTSKYNIPVGYEFLHVNFLDQEISIIDSFDTDEIVRQLDNDGSVGEIIKPGETHSTYAFYVLNKRPSNKVQLDRDITTLYNPETRKNDNVKSFHSIIINL